MLCQCARMLDLQPGWRPQSSNSEDMCDGLVPQYLVRTIASVLRASNIHHFLSCYS